jgi:ABC-2 type transport system permease protein
VPAGAGAAARAEADRGVIHDIGYRHYDGVRQGRRWIGRSLYVDTARGAYGMGRSARTKILPFLLLAVMCLPAIVMVGFTLASGAPDLPADYATYAFTLQVVIVVYVGAQAPVAVSRDLRFGTVTLYFSRPLRRGDYVVARWLGLTTALVVLCALPLTLLLAGAMLARLPFGSNAREYLVALAGVVLLAALLASVSLLIASLTPRRGFGVAAVVAVLLVVAGVQTALMGLGLGEGIDALATYSGLLSPFTLVDGVQAALLHAPSALPREPGVLAGPTTTAEGLVYAATALGVVAAGVALLLVRYRRVAIA